MEDKEQNLIDEVKPQIENDKKQSTAKVVWLTILTVFILVFFTFVLQFRIRYVAMNVEGWSMRPNLNEGTESDDISGDEVYVNSYAQIKAGDIVVISSSALKSNIIKRCIATGGQTVNITGSNVVGQKMLTISRFHSITVNVYDEYYVEVDGVRLDENYINDASNPKVMQSEYESFCLWKYNNGYASKLDEAITLKDNEIFVLGDNRQHSTDSSAVGPFNIAEVVGRVDFVVKYKTNYFQECLQKISFIFIIK